MILPRAGIAVGFAALTYGEFHKEALKAVCPKSPDRAEFEDGWSLIP